MAFKHIASRVSGLVEKLTPRFIGRDQDHLLSFGDELVDVAYDEMYDHVQPLYDFRDDIQSPAGATLVGIADVGGHFTGTDVEAALQELGASAIAGPESSTDNAIARFDGTTGAALQNSGIRLEDDNSVEGIAALEFSAQNANPATNTTQSLYMDDGTNYSNGTLVWNNSFALPNTLLVGAKGVEQDSININGSNTAVRLKSSTFGGTASILVHQHSTTNHGQLYLSRSNSSGSSHAAVTNNMVVGAVTGLGWTGSTARYLPVADMQFGTDTTGTIGNTSAPGLLTFRVTPNGGVTPTEVLRLDSTGTATFTGTVIHPTPSTSDNSTKSATTAFVKAQGYTNNTGTVTSVAVANTTGLTWTGSPITTSGTLTPTLSANLQSWSGIAPSTKADASNPTFTGTSVFNGGVNFGTTVAPGGQTDLSRHITLAGSTYGFSYTANRVNYCAGNSAAHEFFVAGSSVFTVDATQLYANGKAAIRSNDTWLRLNPNNDFTSGIYSGSGLIRSDGSVQIGTTNANGFFCSTSTPPRWLAQELGYRNLNFKTQNANYTLVADDAGKAILHSNASNYTYTIPAVFAIGDIITIVSSSTGTLTLTGSGVNLFLAPGSTAAGNRTVGQRGVATVMFVSTTAALVFGIGVT